MADGGGEVMRVLREPRQLCSFGVLLGGVVKARRGTQVIDVGTEEAEST